MLTLLFGCALYAGGLSVGQRVRVMCARHTSHQDTELNLGHRKINESGGNFLMWSGFFGILFMVLE